jgi:phosphoglycerate kinase
VRAGFDVPLKQNAHHEGWEVVDDTRIRELLPTLKYLIKEKAKITILSKLGRPGGQWKQELSQWPAALALGHLLKMKVVKVSKALPDYAVPHIYFLTADITKADYSGLLKKMKPGNILYLENMFFYPGEEANDPKFAAILKKYGDIYVEEAFASAHHKASSNYGLAKELPSYAGITLLKEISALNKLLRNPQHPMVVLMGGAKIDDKVDVINNLMKHADNILIGGALANTFFKAMGYEIGQSKASSPAVAKDLLRNYRSKLVFPVDLVVAKSTEAPARLSKIEKILPHESILDIGPETIRKFSTYIKGAKTLVWNGPFGLIEKEKFAFGSKSLARIFGARSKGFAYGVVGGGETLELVNQAKVAEFIDHVSTGGGAMLEFLAGKELPAIKVLEK